MENGGRNCKENAVKNAMRSIRRLVLIWRVGFDLLDTILTPTCGQKTGRNWGQISCKLLVQKGEKLCTGIQS